VVLDVDVLLCFMGALTVGDSNGCLVVAPHVKRGLELDADSLKGVLDPDGLFVGREQRNILCFHRRDSNRLLEFAGPGN